MVFAFLPVVAVSSTRAKSQQSYLRARAGMTEAKQTANPIRLLILGVQIKSDLDQALQLDPENLEIRLDLVRFYTVAPRVFGGIGEARAQAAEIAKRDAPLGCFARGYIAYREKEYGAARLELREAVRTARSASTKALALKWLGWLSQETQQYGEAFAVFQELRATDASALYEIGRTSVFCSCETERGRDALNAYLAAKRTAEMPPAEEARKLLGQLTPSADRRPAP
jgi:tetratricopeptide (TPR) repeat protein